MNDSGRATDLQDLQQRRLGWATQGTWGCAVCGGVVLFSVMVASQLHLRQGSMKSERGGTERVTGTEDQAENSQLKNPDPLLLPASMHPQKVTEEKAVSLASMETTIICSFIHSLSIF